MRINYSVIFKEKCIYKNMYIMLKLYFEFINGLVMYHQDCLKFQNAKIYINYSNKYRFKITGHKLFENKEF